MSDKNKTDNKSDNAEEATQKTQTVGASGFNVGGNDTAVTGINLSDDSQKLRAEVERLQNELQRERVEHGRVKALSQSDADKARRIAELERENEELREASQDYFSMLPEELQSTIDPEVAKAIGLVAQKAVGKVREEVRQSESERQAQFAQMQQAESRRREELLNSKINEVYPGFIQSTNIGGDKYDAWMKFLGTYQSSVTTAYQSGSFDSLAIFIDKFLSDIGALPRRDASGAVVSPRQSSTAGATGAGGDSKVYTYEEYAKELERTGDNLRTGEISLDDYRAKIATLTKARDEGRVQRRIVVPETVQS